MTNPSNDSSPTIDERYTSATHATNLRVTVEKTGSVDILIAAAWSPSRLGSALLRLHSEFDGAEHPRKITQEAIERITLTMEGNLKDKAAWAEKIAYDWYQREAGMLLQKLKTMPNVRYQLAMQADKWRLDEPEKIAVKIMIWWLDRTCRHCHGRKWEKIQNTPSLSARHCRHCRGSGETPVPCALEGMRLVDHIEHCVREARASIKKRLHP